MLELFGSINNPLQTINPKGYGDLKDFGLINFVSNTVKLLMIGAGLFAFINLLLAGIQYLGSQGNTEATTQAWAKIYMSMIGLVVMVAAFALTGILGLLLFGDATAILNPHIYGPGAP
jgi:hypothetical protein